ncbi:efflux RND transporter periplasmic adaptor subunit [Paenibacillus alba]|uniref:Efflux RND transporter periplasmic adaptor subunit n=1 Tax=Paenibacillus alba TaxID=1197127 RepID=A0ABU6FUT5_9BACL|nr:efflux RND transporter periplasmic adaptor subunit [Paenibacillus alba]MEC0225653.1 efflux RND transporter periplasmic adaptor subunit [Paenibacillus alba]
MEAAVLTEERSSGKSTKKKTGGIILAFILMMLVLTLFSNTILKYSLPSVSAKRPSFGGGLTFKVNGSGSVEKEEEVKVLSKNGSWPVKEVEVKVGDTVEKGQILVRFDMSNTEAQIDAEQLGYEQQQLNLDKLQISYKEAMQLADDKQAANVARDMESAQLALQVQKRKIDRLRDEINAFSVLTSTEEGVVSEVMAAVGASIAPGSAVISLTKTMTEYEFKADVTNEQAKYLKAGDAIKITIPSLDDAEFEATIKSIKAKMPDNQVGQQNNNPGGSQQQNPDLKEIVAVMKDNRLKGGEAGEFEWKKESSSEEGAILVPNSAIRESNGDGKFVYVVVEKEGSLGKEYFIRKVKLTVNDSDAVNTEIKDGVSLDDFVVTSSNKPIAEGKRVLVSNEVENGSE